jgi:hypothetical protein
MHLNRTTPQPFKRGSEDGTFAGAISEDYRVAISNFVDGAQVVIADFPRYGEGSRRSDFEVEVRWDDVEKILEKFCEGSNPEAIALREARKLALPQSK